MSGALEAGLWGLAGASSLVIGCLIALRFRIPTFALGLIMGFGAGLLISAVAFDLVQDAVATADGTTAVGIGFALGALVFFLGDSWLEGGRHRKSWTGRQAEGNAMAIVLGTILDGIPESIVIGITLLEGGVGFAIVAAVFLSNFPEAIGSTAGMMSAGHKRAHILALWTSVAVISAAFAGFGYAALGGAPPELIAGVQAFAGGALLTMIASAMMPEAYREAGRYTGLATALGFAVAFWLTTL